MLILIAFTASFAYALNEPEESMILYFSFDELDGKNAIDHSLYENHGELIGGPKLAEGKFGKALELNGKDNWVVVPHHEILTVDESVTVMAWINTERHQGPAGLRWQGIVANSNNPRSYSFYTEFPSECLHLSVGGGSVGNKKVPLDEWVHVVAQVDGGSTHKYWVNGEAAGEFGGKITRRVKLIRRTFSSVEHTKAIANFLDSLTKFASGTAPLMKTRSLIRWRKAISSFSPLIRAKNSLQPGDS